jgi:hypothetical protein
MRIPTMPLSDLQVRNAKPGEKVIKLSDGSGLQLWVQPDGSKYGVWHIASTVSRRSSP